MDVLDQLRRQFDYDDWALRETLASLDSSAAPRAQSLFAHTIATEFLWLDRIAHKPPRCPVWPDWTLENCSQRLDELRTAWKTFLRFLEPSALETSISYVNTKGQHYKNTVGDIVTHVLLHSAYHRGQVAAAQRESGAEPAYTDYIHAVREGCFSSGGD